MKYFVERIAGDAAEVMVMVPSTANPHVYEPKPRQMTRLSRIRAYLAIGVEFERVWLDRFTAANPQMAVFHVDQGVSKRAASDHRHEEGHGHEAHQEHGRSRGRGHGADRPDPHVWTSPQRVKTIAANIAEALIAVDPDRSGHYRAGLARFQKDLAALDADIEGKLAGRSSDLFLVYHPSWGYFAEDYGLKQLAVETGGGPPKPAQMAETIKIARQADLKVVFVSPRFSPKSAEVIAKALDGRVVAIDPLAENWAAELRRLADALASSDR
jgi:zinc transport system substrate-binding protein